MRGLPCTGQPSPPKIAANSSPAVAVPSPQNDDSILGRLRRLEQAVFGSGPTAANGPSAEQALSMFDSHVDDMENQNVSSVVMGSRKPSPPRSSTRPVTINERQQTAKFLDSTFTRHGLNISLPHDKLDYRITNISQFPRTPSTTGAGHTPTDDIDGRASTWLMTREEAMSLLEDFTNNPFHMLPIIHAPTTRAMIDTFYNTLSQGQDPSAAQAALILSIAATSAFFFNENSKAFSTFASSEDATQAALAWFRSALNILDQSQQITYGCLAEVQARTILAYLIYNFEGCSGRFRFLHSCSLASAREGLVHLVDSPNSEQQDDATTREIKRRVWWHIAATDWMLGLMGGPTDGTYSVQPRQMNVKYPRNINDDANSLADENIDHPSDTATGISCFLRRIQLAEITRSIIDARTPGAPDAEITDYDQVTQLDRLFADALAELPEFLRPNGTISPSAPPHLHLQRDVVLLGFHSRRARLHRPFLLHDAQDAAHERSRDICLKSARTVLSIAIRLLKGSQKREPIRAYNARAMGRRLGCVIGHMFMACTILALNAGFDTSRDQQRGDAPSDEAITDATAETHAEVAQACRALASAGEESAVAARLVRNLACVLRKYRIQGVDDVEGSESEHAPEPALPDTQDGPLAFGKYLDVGDMTFGVDYVGMLNDDLGLDGLWNGITGDTSTAYGWDQLFAGLDTYCGQTSAF
ncbi:putative transcription factor lepB [Colletotrichum fructicola]|nr:putative transcription factor lepB [Colletotrichum fructicola]